MSTDETSVKKTWRTGCGYVVVSLIFFAGVTGFVALRPVREAKRGEQDLNDRFGEFSAFAPAPDGAVAPDRIEAFITVRERLKEPCGRFQEHRDQFDEIVALDSGVHAFPWQDGLPQPVADSLAPYEDRLDTLFCEATVRFELRQKNKNPGGFGD